eukprot:COSAG01_NODE_719_length_14073_cov_30.141906_13_plen_68_part_00
MNVRARQNSNDGNGGLDGRNAAQPLPPPPPALSTYLAFSFSGGARLGCCFRWPSRRRTSSALGCVQG